MKINLYNKGFVTNNVSSIKIEECNSTLENRIKFVTDIAAISRGKDASNNPEKRYGHLLKEAATDMPVSELMLYDHDVTVTEDTDIQNNISTAGRPFEFIPVIVKVLLDNNSGIITDENDNMLHKVNDITDVIDIVTDLSRYGYNVKNTITDNLFKRGCIEYTIYTNGRNYINVANKYNFTNNEIPFNKSKDFKVFRIKASMFVWGHFMTHTSISKISQSDRVSSSNDYWIPPDMLERLTSLKLNNIDNLRVSKVVESIKDWLNIKDDTYELHVSNKKRTQFEESIAMSMVESLSQSETQYLLKLLGYKREIWSRAPYYFKYKEFVIGGWKDDPKGFGHMLLEREAFDNIRTSWVQEETKVYAKAIKQLIGD